MSQLIRLKTGHFGRIAILDLDQHLVEHAHADNHLQFWLDGSENPVVVDGVATPFNSQCAVAINSWQPHESPKYRPGEHTTFLLLYLRTDWLNDICSQAGRPMGFPRATFHFTRSIQRAAASLCQKMLETRKNSDDNIGPFVKALVLRCVLKMHSGNTLILDSTGDSLIDPRIHHAIQVMNDNIDSRLSLEEIASISGLSRSHFFALFRKALNVSPNVYWNTLRMETAICRLAGSEIPMGDLAEQLGFSEPANFSRFFRLHTGVCPTLYCSVATP